MKVLQVNSVCGIGSTGRIVMNLHEMILKQGHESYIAFGRKRLKSCDDDTTVKIGNKIDILNHVLATRLLDRHGLASIESTKRMIKKISLIKPDLIHLHNLHGYYINVELLFNYIKCNDIPVVWTLHDCWAFTGHCTHFEDIECDKWKTSCYDCPIKNSYPASYFMDNSKSNFKKKKKSFSGVNNLTIVTPSKWLSELVDKSFLNEYKVEIINNGIDLDIFCPVRSGFRKTMNIEDKFIILGVSSFWNESKGLYQFYELAKQISRNDIIVLVGVTDKQIKELPENIIGVRKTNNMNELAEIYTSADVFVNPTISDTFPTTNLESLACGTPVITFRTGGSPESICKNCGIIVEKGNLNELLSAISEVKRKGKEFYVLNALNHANSQFNKEDKFLNYIKVYKSLVNLTK